MARDLPARVRHRYFDVSESLLPTFLKTQAEGEAEGWIDKGEQRGVQISQKLIPGTPNGILRGVGVVENASPRDIMAIIANPDARLLWDSLFESGVFIEWLDPYYRIELTYASTKPVFPTSSRDLVVVLENIYEEDGTIRSLFCSVSDPQKPEVKGKVRAEASVSGWSLKPVENGTEITYISQTDPKGWIPASAIQAVSSQIPLCVAGVRNYFDKFGPPPYFVRLAGKLTNLSLNNDESEYTLEYQVEQYEGIPSTQIYISPRRYKGGVKISVSIDGLKYSWNQKETLLTIISGPEFNNKNVRVVIRKNNLDTFQVVVNNSVLNSQEESDETNFVDMSSSSVTSFTSQHETESSDQLPLEKNLNVKSRSEVPILPRAEHRHKRQTERLMETFNTVLNEGSESGWQNAGNQKGVDLLKKDIQGTPTGILKGTTIIPDCTPMEFMAVISSAEARKYWDELFDDGRGIELFDGYYHVTLIYAKLKPFRPTSARDLCVVQEVSYRDDGTIQIASMSVTDDQAPENSSYVRAYVTIAGWSIKPIPEGISVSYISQSDPKGWIPSSALRAVSSSIPLCVATSRDYFTKFGPPPFLIDIAGNLTQELIFDHNSSTASFQYKSNNTKSDVDLKKLQMTNNTNDLVSMTTIFLSPKRYPTGVTIEINQTKGFEVSWDNQKKILGIKDNNGKGDIVKVTIQKGTFSQFKVIVNQKEIHPGIEEDFQIPSKAGSSSRSTSSIKAEKNSINSQSSQDEIDASQGAPEKIKHRHHRITDNLTERFEKILTETTKDGWELRDETQGIKIYRKQDGSPTGILKGVGIVEGALPYEMIGVATTIDTRQYWDNMFDNARLVEVLDPYYRVNMTYGCSKALLVTSARDVSLVQVITEKEDGTLYNVTTSIEDAKLPEVPKKVRAHTMMGSWRFQPHSKGTEVTYVSQNDPKGWIPSTVLQLASTQIPLCVAGVRDYFLKHGSPPFVTQLAGETVNTEFDHDSSKYTLTFKSQPTNYVPISKVFVSLSRYPNGFDVTVTPSERSSIRWDQSKNILFVKTAPSENAKLIISKRSSSTFQITLAGVIIFPQQESPKTNPKTETTTSEQKPSLPVAKRHKYTQAFEESRATFLELLKESREGGDIWKSIGEEKGIKITRKTFDNPFGGYIKGEGEVQDFSPLEFYTVQMITSCKLKWDPLLEEVRIIESLGPNEELQYVIIKGQVGMAKRDLVVIFKCELLPDGSIITYGKSVNDPREPETSKAVRAECPIGGMCITPVVGPNNKITTKVEYITLTDIKGWIPGPLLKMFSTSVPMSIYGISNYLKTYGSPPCCESLGGILTEKINFDIETSDYLLQYKVDTTLPTPTILKFPPKKYPSGALITIDPPTMIVKLHPSGEGIEVYPDKAIANESKVSIKASPKLSGSQQTFTINGKLLAREDVKEVKEVKETKKTTVNNANEIVQLKTLLTEMESLKRKTMEMERLSVAPKQKLYGPFITILIVLLSLLLGVFISSFLKGDVRQSVTE